MLARTFLGTIRLVAGEHHQTQGNRRWRRGPADQAPSTSPCCGRNRHAAGTSRLTSGCLAQLLGHSPRQSYNEDDFCFWQILLQKSKIERPRKSRERRFLDAATAAMPSRADTKTGGRFCMKRCGPSRRRMRNASAALKNFVRQPKKTFSTPSARTGPTKSV